MHWEPDYTGDMQEEVGTALWAGITIKGGSGEREEASAANRSIGSTTSFHNHGEGPY